MDKGAVFQKTEKGQSEIATRAYKLPARVRSVLILVDGKSTGAHVIDQAKHFGDAEQYFVQLIEGGFIEPVAATVSTPPPAAPAAAPPPPPASAPAPRQASPEEAGKSPSGEVIRPPANRLAAFVATKAFATRYFIDLLGPDGEMLAVRIEKARDETELLTILDRSREVVRHMRGAERADRYWKQVQALILGEA